MVKNMPARKISMPAGNLRHVRSLGQEDPLEEEMTTHSSILAWEIPWIGEPGGLQSMGSAKSQTLLRDSTTTNTKNSHFNENNKSYELLSSLLGLQTTIFFFFFFFTIYSFSFWLCWVFIAAQAFI